MNSRERFMVALALQQPDRVPIMEGSIHPNVWRPLCPAARDDADVQDQLDLDAVCCRAPFATVSEQGEYFTDEWGVVYKKSAEVTQHPYRGPIETLADLRTYTPPDPTAAHRLAAVQDTVAHYKGQRAIVFKHRAAFMWSAYLMGLDNLLFSFLQEPRLAAAVLDMVVEVNEEVIRRAVRAGADVVMLLDDYAANTGPLMSPEVFRQFVLPRLQRVVDTVHAEGALCIKHTDGNIWKILDMIVDTGIDAINPLEPCAGMDIGEVKRQYGRRVCLVGNIDCGALLVTGTTTDVEQAVKDCIRAAAPDGGYILSSSNSIQSGVRPENLRAMIEAGRKWGSYPLAV